MEVHRLPVAGGHVLHVEVHGNPEGIPLLVLHGGPGSGCSEVLRRPLDASTYRIVCPDQRGAGRSEPAGETRHNTLAHLLADLRAVRSHLGIGQWLVTGGSWGATLAVLHAIDAPHAVSGLLLRNVFLARRADIRGFLDAAVAQGGAAWQAHAQAAARAGVPLETHLGQRFAHASPEAARELARLWWTWEQHLAGARNAHADPAALDAMVQRCRVQTHYLSHQCWLGDVPLLDRCGALPGVPVRLLHGTADRVCPPEGAAALARAIGPRARLQWIKGAGHDPAHPSMLAAMQQAQQRFAQSGQLA